jgi:hypothetical protein
VIPFQFHGKHDVKVPGVPVAEEVMKGSLFMGPYCEHIVYMSVPSFQFHKAGIDGLHFESCHKYVGQQGDNGDCIAMP